MSKQENKMSRYLRPDRFDVEPNSTEADLKWLHWRFTFENFLTEECTIETKDTMKLNILVNHLSPTLFSYIRGINSYDIAIKTLEEIYVKPKNEILARHMLATRTQKPEETVSEYYQALNLMSRECNFKEVSAEEHRCQSMRGAFIAGIISQKTKERLLEKLTLELDEAVNLAISLESAERNTRIMSNKAVSLNSSTENELNLNATTSSKVLKRRCFFCGSNNLHQRIKCPAFRVNCQLCSKKGHFASVCRSKESPTVNTINVDRVISSDSENSSAILAASPSSLKKATIPITINEYKADALIDTGSSVSFIDRNLAQLLKLKVQPCQQTISLASLSHVSFVEGLCHATLKIDENQYHQQQLLIVNNLCADVIVGHDILKNHSKLELKFGGSRKPLRICNVMEASLPPATLFSNLSHNIRPIAVRSRRYSKDDEEFIKLEVDKLLEDRVIEPSNSPWRAQVLVAGGGHHRKRMVINYAQTINRFTELDAFPLPNIESIVAKVAKYNHFSQIDLKSAYHQIPILPREKPYTAFEANGKLYQFTRIPFGVTNGVAAFQRALSYVIETENLKGTFAYLDDVTICGKTQKDHDKNLEDFMKAATKYNLTLNEQKCKFNIHSINLLGYNIQNGIIKPDPDRLKPLMDLPLPENASALKRALGLFAHYSRWIPNFSEKIKPLLDFCTFPFSEESITSFESLKKDILKASLAAIDENATFTVETDASGYAIAATLSQNGQPVAFFSRSLTYSEKRHSSIEKEAAAIVESLRKWRHYLIGRHFNLITDQQSVSFMFDQRHSSKIKNEKIERWRLELSCFKYDIIYRPGKENKAADTLSRVCALISNNTDSLKVLHERLCHPGVTRMVHWVRSKNLPYSINDVRQITQNCQICAEIKPRYARSRGNLIKATAPFERLNIDFKGPLPSKTLNKYILTIVDEYSRFPFAFPCKDVTTTTVIKCLHELFSLFGTPMYIHSDRGSAFMSQEFLKHLISLDIASSRTTPYNPQGNGQVERMNGTLWKTILLSLRSQGLETSDWEKVLPNSLHSIRSLLCTSTNTTPHERMFFHQRRSPNGVSLPGWLMSPGRILIKRTVRNSKFEPLVQEGQLLQSNPTYSYVKYPDGREGTISNRYLAPLPHTNGDYSDSETEDENVGEVLVETEQQESIQPGDDDTGVRRSTRLRRTPAYLQDYD